MCFCLCVWEESHNSSHLSFEPLLLFHLVTDAPGEWLWFWYLLACVCTVPPRHKLTTFLSLCAHTSAGAFIHNRNGRTKKNYFSKNKHSVHRKHRHTHTLGYVRKCFIFKAFPGWQGIVHPINSVEPESLSREDELFGLFQVTPDPNTADVYRGY